MADTLANAVPPPFKLDTGTVISLGIAFSLMPLAQGLAAFVLPSTTPRKYYWLFLWHAYDFLTHFLIEGSFLYHCFFSYIQLAVTEGSEPSRGGSQTLVLFDRPDRRYGAFYSSGPMARLWAEYAKADSRWGGADLMVISIELITVFLDGPGAVYICYLIAKIANGKEAALKGQHEARLWFVAIVVATLELVGGFYTFAPEWLSGNHSLAGDDPVYLWLYLVFFNMLWVFVPFWVLYVAYDEIHETFKASSSVTSANKRK
ncbi:hypothetical protein PV05_11507 [Exophiala xenobiotica]|uniref:EXPERA domain-containing protein n=1 Tax=Exophiala xenobiotica TaxID=348802 RepID=A0A0D2BCL4_9EURO|nr:uncharacterized protein PV05_11507 [Exophiala xenobiotica]KIW49866.1 hypothetical protein PV05_11507 [Exophiala xenobiotica]